MMIWEAPIMMTMTIMTMNIDDDDDVDAEYDHCDAAGDNADNGNDRWRFGN